MRGHLIEGINYFKRHSATCKVHNTRLSADDKKAFMDCDCVVHIYGRVGQNAVPRQSTGEKTLKDAQAVVAAMLRSQAKDHQQSLTNGPTIASSIQKYLEAIQPSRKGKTIDQHKLILERFHQFTLTRNKVYMKDLSVDLVEEFRAQVLARGAATTYSTRDSKLRRFLKEAERRDWLPHSILEKLDPVKAVYEEKEPYTENEIRLIMAGALRLRGGTHGYASRPPTFRLLLELMLETGMRVGDAILYNPGVVRRGKSGMWIYTFIMQKRKKIDVPSPIDAFLTDRLKTAIDGCDWLSTRRPFEYGPPEDPNSSFANPSYLANEVYYRMQSIGKRCNVADCRPHRLRDTFAIRKLLAGFKLHDVQRLLGHRSVRVTEKFYAKWVSDRVDALEAEVAASQSLV